MDRFYAAVFLRILNSASTNCRDLALCCKHPQKTCNWAYAPGGGICSGQLGVTSAAMDLGIFTRPAPFMQGGICSTPKQRVLCDGKKTPEKLQDLHEHFRSDAVHDFKLNLWWTVRNSLHLRSRTENYPRRAQTALPASSTGGYCWSSTRRHSAETERAAINERSLSNRSPVEQTPRKNDEGSAKSDHSATARVLTPSTLRRSRRAFEAGFALREEDTTPLRRERPVRPDARTDDGQDGSQLRTQSSRSPSEGEEEEEDRHTDLSLIASIASATGDATPLAAAAREYRIRARSTIDEKSLRRKRKTKSFFADGRRSSALLHPLDSIRSLKTLQWERNPSLQGSVQDFASSVLATASMVDYRSLRSSGADHQQLSHPDALALIEMGGQQERPHAQRLHDETSRQASRRERQT
ncbi:hypothetical protein DFH06DRAFT_1126671 [Mycena polygramma]|nr:hypothetical protein DFH06DRAFT_1126671 [Mycena polygramma]